MVVRPGSAQRGHYLLLSHRILVLAHLDLADESRDGQPDTAGAFRDRPTPVDVQEHRLFDLLLEMRDKSGEYGEVLLLIEELRYAVAVRGAEVPRRCADRSWCVPTRRDVSMVPALDDQQHLTITKVMDLVVRLADMSEHHKSVGLFIDQDRIVRRDQLAGVIADQRAPRVLPDQPAYDVGIVLSVKRVVAHGRHAGA